MNFYPPPPQLSYNKLYLYITNFLCAVTLCSTVFVLSGCTEANLGNSKVLSASPSISETFTVTSVTELQDSDQTSIEMLWIVDSSTSMAPYIAAVKQRTVGLFSHLKSLTGLPKLAFIANIAKIGNDDWSFQPSQLPGVLTPHPPNTNVPSKVALFLAMGYLCKTSMNVCGDMTGRVGRRFELNIDDGTKATIPDPVGGVKNLTWDQVWQYYSRGKAPGALGSFFSSGMPKVIVVISDDDSTISSDDFLGFWRGQYKEIDTLRFYGFIAPQRGNNYQALAQATRGKTYDITNITSWDSALNDFSSHISNTFADQISIMLKTSFSFTKGQAQDIDTVFIDGVRQGIDALESHSSTGFQVKKSYVKNGSKIVVTYFPTAPKEKKGTEETNSS